MNERRIIEKNYVEEEQRRMENLHAKKEREKKEKEVDRLEKQLF